MDLLLGISASAFLPWEDFLSHERAGPAPTSPTASLPPMAVTSAGGYAAGLVRAALLPESNVDFPQITEICERLEAVPSEAPEAVALLVTVLRGRQSYRTKLKALTISNEMLYDERTIMAFKSEDGLREALGTLRSVRNTGLGDTVDENIRMLATEVDKVCFSAPQQAAPQGDGKLRKNTSGSKSFGHAMRSNLRTAADTFADAAGFSSKKLDRTQVSSAMSSTANAVERRLERTGETLERAAGYTANAFYKASAKMMESAERTFTGYNTQNSRAIESGTSTSTSPKSRKNSLSPQQIQWIPSSSEPVHTAASTEARWQAATVTPAVASNARVVKATPIQGTPGKAEAAELQAAQKEEQQLQWALAQSLMEMQAESLSDTKRSADSSAEDARSSRERRGGRETESPAADARLQEAENREARAQRALAEAQNRISAGRSEMRQLRSQIADSRNSMASLNERLYDADCDLQRVTTHIAELERLFVAAKHSIEACLASEVSDATQISLNRGEEGAFNEHPPDE